MEIGKKSSKKIIKKYLILLAFIITLVTIYEITSIYAVFHSEAVGNVSKNLAKWKILVNNQDIVSGTEQTFNVGEFIIPNNSVIEGKFAPGLEGYFEFTIEPQDTQVSVRYDITIDQSQAIAEDIHLISVEEVATNNTLTETAQDTYTGVMPLSVINNNYVNTIRITFKWEEDESNLQNGTTIETNTLNVKIPITVNVKQYLGEAIAGI